MKIGFDIAKYMEEQSKYILERVAKYEKLYIEFGGKLLNDMHAKRVLPGFDENAKIKLMHHLKDSLEVVICVFAGDIERNKIRGDFGITYDQDVLKLIDQLRAYDLSLNSVVITRFDGQHAATAFMNKLQRRGITVYTHSATKGYPFDVDTIVSEEGYGQNPYITTTKPIVIVTGPGPGSGKLATCLSQLYHEFIRGNEAGYSKFETFPVWNMPLKHPVNIAYEAATVDLKDVNLIDSFHLEHYGEVAINYNRDIEAFPVLKRILSKITGKDSIYHSPTDMGVNRVGFGIVDDDVIREASKQEVIRRYFKTGCDYKKGLADEETFLQSKRIMEELNLKEDDRDVVLAVRDYVKRQNELCDGSEPCTAMAIALDDGTLITGKRSNTMDASAATVINAIKFLAGISDDMHLLSPIVLEPIIDLKRNTLKHKVTALNCEEIIIALSICAATNPMAHAALGYLSQLNGCQAHSSAILNATDEHTYRDLGIELTCDPVYATESLFDGS